MLHSVNAPDRDYKWKDRLNSVTGHLNCRFLEWSGWYSQDIQQRLLGHYRLFHLFTEKHIVSSPVPLSSLYILSYRSFHRFKHFLCRAAGVLFYFFTFGEYFQPVKVEGINHALLFEHPDILSDFLNDADVDFESALRKAIAAVSSERFLKQPIPSVMLFQKQEHHQHYQSSNHYFN